MDMVLARNPDGESSLGYLLRVPLGEGLVFRTSGTWPRTKALFCYPVELDEWPDEPDVVDRVPVRSCVRRGAAIDLVLDRGRENRSQIVFTRGRGRDMVFWQSPKTRKQARPQVRTPTARAAGVRDAGELERMSTMRVSGGAVEAIQATPSPVPAPVSPMTPRPTPLARRGAGRSPGRPCT